MNVNNNTDVSMGSFKALSANQTENETVKNETEKSVFEQIDDLQKMQEKQLEQAYLQQQQKKFQEQ